MLTNILFSAEKKLITHTRTHTPQKLSQQLVFDYFVSEKSKMSLQYFNKVFLLCNLFNSIVTKSCYKGLPNSQALQYNSAQHPLPFKKWISVFLILNSDIRAVCSRKHMVSSTLLRPYHMSVHCCYH